MAKPSSDSTGLSSGLPSSKDDTKGLGFRPVLGSSFSIPQLLPAFKDDKPEGHMAGRATHAPTQSETSLTRDGLGAGTHNLRSKPLPQLKKRPSHPAQMARLKLYHNVKHRETQ